jgi:prolyl-tRNA synthetase
MSMAEGITVKKAENPSEWYTQVIQKAELIDYTDVSGCYVFRPRSFAIWEKLREFFDCEIKKLGVQNLYFPMFIPESFFKKEAEHVEGFAPEVAWVTHSGNTELKERLAIRPTSEAIISDSFRKWTRSWKDLPIKVNQWCNVVRWEFNNPQPFLRTREFLWQEGHTLFVTKEDADKEVMDILELYRRISEELYAMPALLGKKSEKEKFAGADYTTSVECFLPTGKAIQLATSHALGQNFAKAFEIEYTDANEEKQHPYQNSWGISTRSIGVMVIMHSDDKGLVVPPRVALNKAVIVPITTKKVNEEVIKKAKEVYRELKGFNVIFDDREGYSPGWKYNEWEMKGIPVRIEIGPKDVEKDQVVFVRRDNGEKVFVPILNVKERLKEMLEDMQGVLLDNAKSFLKENTLFPKNKEELKTAVNDGKLSLINWCGGCEESIKELGAKTLNMPFDQNPKGSCVNCGSKAKFEIYVSKSY